MEYTSDTLFNLNRNIKLRKILGLKYIINLMLHFKPLYEWIFLYECAYDLNNTSNLVILLNA